MISIFNGRKRTLGRATSEIYAQVNVDFRDVLNQFKGARLGVFLAIALHGDADGWAWPSYSTLARETGYSKKAIRQALADLCTMRIDGHRVLLRYQEKAGGGKQFSSNRYLLFPSPYQIRKYADAGIKHLGDTGSGFGPRGDKRLPRENEIPVVTKGDHGTVVTKGDHKEEPLSNILSNNGRDSKEPDPAALLWADVLADLRGQMTPVQFSDWLEPTSAVALDDGTLTVAVVSDRARDWLDNRLRSPIERTVTSIHGEPLSVEFVLSENGGSNDLN